ncbi:hypothetical protein HMPREF1984_02227 [Leptotrichia sp. oral taxon 215 str. W9775]|nr:hypothetical protein HMPREF1984_02227 [Leptotrichia sp. oral taxon 215 str. W9775]
MITSSVSLLDAPSFGQLYPVNGTLIISAFFSYSRIIPCFIYLY